MTVRVERPVLKGQKALVVGIANEHSIALPAAASYRGHLNLAKVDTRGDVVGSALPMSGVNLSDRRWVPGRGGHARVRRGRLPPTGTGGRGADTLTLYHAVSKVRMAPIDRRAVVAVAGAAVLPILPVAAIEVPIKVLSLKVLM